MSANGVGRTTEDAVSIGRKIPLTAAEIHLWFADCDEIAEELHADYRELLNASEKEQEERFYFARDRRRYLITRALVRTVLSRYVAIPPKEWIFNTNPYGRPGIANALSEDVCLTFNISHTRGLIVLGVTLGRDLGVDVAHCEGEAPIAIAERYFSPPETAILAAAPTQEQNFRFFEFWTLKEAYIKARGMGLSLPLDKFSFQYPRGGAVEIAIDAELADDPVRWQFWQCRPRPQYLMAICAERLGTQPPALIARQSVPLCGERRVSLEFLRVSGDERNDYDNVQNGGKTI